MISEAAMKEMETVCPGVREMVECGTEYLYLPRLRVPCTPNVLDALLCLRPHGGYTTRLFLSAQVVGRGTNWSAHHILGRTWYTWSWNNVPGSGRPAEVLADHLQALR
jgi:hypothetical protein